METPVALFTGDHDWLSDPKDVALLKPKLKNMVYHKDIKPWDHLDFIWGLDAADLVYKPVINLIKALERTKKPTRLNFSHISV